MNIEPLAVSSSQEQIRPLDIVIQDQFIDETGQKTGQQRFLTREL